MKLKDVISKEVYKERLSICSSCESYDSKYNRCKDCGCFLMLKAILTATKCPQGKWDGLLEDRQESNN